MKWFNFLKNRAGKLALNMQSAVVLSIGVGVLGVSIVHNLSDNMPKQELAARSLSSISNAYDYGGLRRTKEGLSSMNMANLSGGLDGIASAEERARMEAKRTGNGQFGLDAADNMGRNVASAMSGLASQTGDSEGLGMGKNAVVMQNNTSGSANANTPYVSADAIAGRGQNARGASGASNQLAPASARTSGGGVNNSGFGGSSSSAGMSGPGGSSSSSGSSGREEGYRLSGAMPGGTNPVSMRRTDGRNSSGFRSGRDATVGHGQRFKSTGNELKDISRQSAKIAANSHRSANAGSQPFLASSQITAGMSFNKDEAPMTESSDLQMKSLPEQEDSINNYGNQVSDEGDKRQDDRDRLIKMLLALVAATIVITFLACRFLDMGGPWGYGIGYALLALLAAYVFNFDWAANNFRKAYPDTSHLPLACDILSGVVLSVIALTAIPYTRMHLIEMVIGKGVSFLVKTGISFAGMLGLSKFAEWLKK